MVKIRGDGGRQVREVGDWSWRGSGAQRLYGLIHERKQTRLEITP